MVLTRKVQKMVIFFYPTEKGIRYAKESHGMGEVCKREGRYLPEWTESNYGRAADAPGSNGKGQNKRTKNRRTTGADVTCLLYTIDAADDQLDVRSCRLFLIIKNKKLLTHK